MECQICVKNYNNQDKRKIICFKCNFECCLKCIETYLIKSNKLPLCMNCFIKWDTEFLINNVTKAFLKRLKTHKANYYFNIEKNLINLTQKYIEYDNDIDNDVIKLKELDVQINKLNKIIKNSKCPNCNFTLNYYLNRICDNCDQRICNTCRKSYKNTCFCFKSPCECEAEYRDNSIHICDINAINNARNFYSIVDRIEHLNEYKYDLEIKISDWENNYNIEYIHKNNQSIIKCPSDDCKGLIQKNYICNICNTKICNKCYHIFNDNHICDISNIKSILEIKNNCKQCPSCSSFIHKIDGCDQMWCTECHTTFNWLTGEIENKMIHNPHYIEWLKKYNKEISHNCDGIPNDIHFIRHVNLAFNNEIVDKLISFYTLIVHIQEIEIEKYQVMNDEKRNLKYRIKWIKNKISDNTFKFKLLQNETKYEINLKIKNIYESFIAISTDILHKILNLSSDNYLKELDNLINYINICFINISKIYNCFVPEIIYDNNEFDIIIIKI